ncbi:methylenetetrahydrofolate reductase [Marisediminicola senii]|uniref:methylenetetrahydrofolate reductase n=1 Tax=Marisediminicola senii TaxID=2711233 RepID=UPI0013EBC9A1|nr:methylenetetrahydrofolate reductase [Marisediminicola senii]
MTSTEPACSTAPHVSFELFPPRSPQAEDDLRVTIRELAAVCPDFISVTYGAGGSSRAASLEVLRYILHETSISPMAHLTCVGSSHAESSRLVREFLDAGVSSFLALRGDPPAGAVEGDDFLGDLRTSSELVQLIDRVQAERSQYATVASPSSPGLGYIPQTRDHVRVAVATFPNGHSNDRRDNQDIDALVAKQTAGATVAITQLFFDQDDYLGFVERATAGGVTIPILPGIMPVVTPERLHRMVTLTRNRQPDELMRRLASSDDPDARFAAGVQYAADLATAVLAGGAPGLHLYTYNQHRPVLAMLERLGVTAGPRIHPTQRTPND